jgi:RimJ/RimL family protein N-acetyltransferase
VCDAGIALGREYIGRGYNTDAIRVFVGYGFRELGLYPFSPGWLRSTLPGSAPMRRAGFVEEDRYRESVLDDGRWYDEVLMSILDHEWAAADRLADELAKRPHAAWP